MRVLRIIHFFYDFPPHPFFNDARLNLVKHFTDFNFDLEGILVFQQNFQKVVKRIFDVHLDKSELFITLVLQNFAKKCHIVVFSVVELDTVDERDGPLYDEVFKAVFLVQIGVYILFHCFSWLFGVFTLLIEFYLLWVHVLDCVFELFQSQWSVLYQPNLPLTTAFWAHDSCLGNSFRRGSWFVWI